VMDQDTPGEAPDATSVPEQAKPLYMARLRRQLATSLFRLGPIPLGIIGAILITLLALLYLNEVSLANQARLRLQQLATQQTQLQQQNQQLLSQQGIYQSPAYIENQARHMGMEPEDPSHVPTIIIPGEPR
jgi:hypothetical protein